ncbi:hypothetical protein LXL04_003871 [Taraxacum kok-saghyz]
MWDQRRNNQSQKRETTRERRTWAGLASTSIQDRHNDCSDSTSTQDPTPILNHLLHLRFISNSSTIYLHKRDCRLFLNDDDCPALHNDDDFQESKINIVICSHDDQFMIIATEIWTMGTIMHARKEEGMLNNPTFNVSVIFGFLV